MFGPKPPRLRPEHPDALRSYPNLDVGAPDSGPYRVVLSASAVSIAERLKERFGDALSLQVGALQFARAGTGMPTHLIRQEQSAAELPRTREGVRLEESLTVVSGERKRHGLIVENNWFKEFVLDISGELISHVVRADSGELVGGLAEFR